jgi:hypothetical protein
LVQLGDEHRRLRAAFHAQPGQQPGYVGYTQLIAGALNLAPRWYVGSALRNVDFVASDVTGFPMPIYLAGARVRMQYAFSPTIGAVLNVALLSYVDTCALGINVDTARFLTSTFSTTAWLRVSTMCSRLS